MSSTKEPLGGKSAVKLKPKPKAKPSRLRITKKLRAKVANLARYGIKPEEIANVLEQPVEKVVAALKDPRIGRPPKVITTADLENIETLSGIGLTRADIAYGIGMHPDTFRKLEQEDTEGAITYAVESGKSKAKGNIASSIYSQGTAGNMTAAIWWEKTRAGMTDRLVIENKVREEVTDVFAFLRQNLDEDTFNELLEGYTSDFCSVGNPEEPEAPEVYR